MLTGSVLTTTLQVPNIAALVGTTCHAQVIALETGFGGALMAATATNRLTFTLGSF